MSITGRLVAQFIAINIVLFCAVGCYDAVDGDDDNQFDISDPVCDAGQVPDPVTGECISDPETSPCEEGEEFDAEFGQCCPEGQFFDRDSQTCTPGADDCDEIWDPELKECVEYIRCGQGAIVGQTCRADGGTIADASVTADGTDCNGNSVVQTTTADTDGHYEFPTIPTGVYTLEIESGSFVSSEEITVTPDNTTDMKGQDAICLDGSEVNVAVIPGDYDDMKSILGGLDIEYDRIDDSHDFFGDQTIMEQYDIIFVECPAIPPWDDADSHKAQNLNRYVRQGNSLYVSDLSSPFITDTLSDDENMVFDYGSGSGTFSANIVDDDFQAYFGSDSLDVNFVFAGWSRVILPGPNATVLLEGDVGTDSAGPLMVRYDEPLGGGRALFTSFHNSEQATGDIQDIFEYVIFQL